MKISLENLDLFYYNNFFNIFKSSSVSKSKDSLLETIIGEAL